MTDRNRILAHLTQPIPAPYVPPPVPRASRWGLKPDQRLRRLTDSTEWTVAGCDNQGVTLRPTGGDAFDDLRLTDAAWQTEWAKVRAPRKPKVKESKP